MPLILRHGLTWKTNHMLRCHVPANQNPQAGKENMNTSITSVFQIRVGKKGTREAKPNRDMNSETTKWEAALRQKQTAPGQKQRNIKTKRLKKDSSWVSVIY